MTPKNTPNTDENGHLKNWQEWSESLAEQWARRDGIELSDDHWTVMRLLREFYQQTGEIPPMRLLVRVIRNQLGEEYGDSRFLYRLFSDQPIKHLCLYAGLPKPPHCI